MPKIIFILGTAGRYSVPRSPMPPNRSRVSDGFDIFALQLADALKLEGGLGTSIG